ncbi:hypothetical protein ACMFKE_11485 [Staphylococcus haemolyticus]|uniref:hypothetical protein n=1 Tax=Staphylococcus haemolyticus TaxID=1283 RepID=UPI0039BC277C
MTIETKRIYEISREQFYGVFQIEWLNDGLEHLSRPVAVIEWSNELKEVLPFQVKFKEDKK